MFANWIRHASRESVLALQTLARSPAAWFYAACYLGATAYMLVADNPLNVLVNSALQFFLLLFVGLTVFITAPIPPEPSAPRDAPTRLWMQVAVILVFILLTGYTALGFHNLISPQAAHIPLWTPLLDFVADLGERFLPSQLFHSPGNSLVNPVAYFVIPLAALLLLGARLPELGFTRGHRSWWVILLWCGIPALMWSVQILFGALNPLRLLTLFIGNFFQNGFFEEFLFRGALQTRLTRLFHPSWGLVLASLVFGLWHLGADVRQLNGDWLGGIALTIHSQALLGIVFGAIFIRTRNLFACSIVHVTLNTLFQA